MKNIKQGILSLGILLLVSSCGQSVIAKEITPEELALSIKTLKDEETDKSYNNYLKKISSDTYVDAKYEQTILPTKEADSSSTLEDYDDENRDYIVALASNTSVTYNFSLNEKANGRYTLLLEYCVPPTFSSSALAGIKVNGNYLFDEAKNVELSLRYEDDVEKNEDGTKNFDSYVSRYGDQLYPKQKRYSKLWQETYLYDTTYQTSDPLIFDLTNATKIEIENLSDSIFFVGKLKLVPYIQKDSYISYLNNVSSSKGSDNLKINAIEYTYKNNNEVRLSSEQTPSVTPTDSIKKLLNIVYSWEDPGQSVTYEFDVKTAGLYPITLHYYNSNDNFPSFRTFYIDGKVPYEELKNYRLASTGSSYANETLKDSNGNPLYVYLETGHHKMEIQASIEPSYEIYKNLMMVYDSINDFAIDIRTITGASIDTNRVYKITEQIPYAVSALNAYKTIIYDSYNKIKALVGNDDSSNSLSYFPRMIELIDEFIDEPNDIPLHLTKFSSGDSCLAKLVADTANTLIKTPLVLDMLYLTNDETIIPKANASFISSLKNSFINLGQTFTSDKYKTELVDGELNIWSARSQAYNDILQSLADNYFTPNTVSSDFPKGIKVNIRQMPSEDNLIYAYAANTVPDLVLGINSGRAYEFALRGDAAYPLSDFDNKWKYTNNNYWNFTPYYWDVADNVPHGQLMSMLYNDKFYSIPESSSVQLMFSRDDILNVIGEGGQSLEIPNTWEELKGQLKRIQSYDMNFYYPVSASGSLKSLNDTSQFILQYGGKLLSDDAFSVNFRSDECYNALKLLTNLYTIYSLPTEVGSFYNSFRYGTLPLGIGTLDMYLQLKYVAPELLGKWSVHLVPGVEQEPNENGEYADLNNDGIGDEVSRWYVSNGSAAMIFNNSKMIDEAWLFLQWWLSTDIQVEYTNSLQSTFGPSVIWFSANKEAAKQLPIDESVREVVLEQQKWIMDLQQIPGQYMLLRGLSDIWNTVVFGTSSSGQASQKETIGNAIDLQKVVVDREIQRKMEEFGYYDATAGKAKKEYKLRDLNWVNECFKQKGYAK